MMSFYISDLQAAGIIKDVPERKIISNENYEFLFEHGRLRYFTFCGNEFIRMLHVAVRDENWMTVPYEVADLDVLEGEKLLITYSALYTSATVSFSAQIKIEADQYGMQFSFSGTAENDFLKNRIGICLLLPVQQCSNQQCSIINAAGERVEGQFPGEISPHQPFIDIIAMEWQTKEGIAVAAGFSNEIFEMEDQRNWADHSFKIYGTPLSIPFPVRMKRGDKINQSVSLHFRFPEKRKEKQIISLEQSGADVEFPLIGLQYTGHLQQHNTGAGFLKALSIHHLRINLSFDENWEVDFSRALLFSVESGTRVELVVTVKDDRLPLATLSRIVQETGASVFSITLLSAAGNITVIPGLPALVSGFKDHFKDVQIGTGTSLHFAEINRFYELQPGIDFLAFPVNPQVHATDTLTIIENLGAFPEILHAASKRFTKLPVHISRLTLRYPDNPDRSGDSLYDFPGRPWVQDHRQNSLLCAAWMALSLKYLAGAASITLFDDCGGSGIVDERGNVLNHPHLVATHAYLVLLEIALFAPTTVSNIVSSRPLVADAVCFCHAAGKKLYIMVNWSGNNVTVENDLFGSDADARYKLLSEDEQKEILQMPLDWAGKGYAPFDLSKGNSFELGAGKLCFVLLS